MNMRMKSVCVFFSAVSSLALPSGAGDVRWTGAGDGSSWSDGANWEGAVVPGEGDTAVIPDNVEAVVDGAAVAGTLNDLAGITMEGDESILCISNLQSSVNLTVPLSGKGHFYNKNQKTGDSAYHLLTMSADNSAFAGDYHFVKAGLQLAHKNALGGQSGGALYIELASKQRLALSHNYTFYNELYIKGNGYGNSLFIFYEGGTWDGDIHVSGAGIAFHTNTSSWKPVINGDVTVEVTSGAVNYSMGNGTVTYNGKVNVISAGNSYGGNVQLGGEPRSKNFGSVYATMTWKCLTNDVFVYSYGGGFHFGNSSSLTLDMNGFDQDLSQICRSGKVYIKSATPATFSNHGAMQNWDQAGYTWYTADDGADMLQGSASYLFCPTNVPQAHHAYGRLQSMNCTTDGRVAASAGKFIIADTATFSNLTELVAFGKVNPMTINTVGINPVNGLEVLAVTNTATMEFKADMTQKTRDVILASTAKLKIGAGSTVVASHRAYLDGEVLPLGVYGKKNGTYADGTAIPPAYQLDCLTGDGYMDVQGPKGMMLIFK